MLFFKTSEAIKKSLSKLNWEREKINVVNSSDKEYLPFIVDGSCAFDWPAYVDALDRTCRK